MPELREGILLARCTACSRVSYVDGLQGFHTPWPCTWCGQYNHGFRQNQDPAAVSAADLAAEVHHYGHRGSPADPDTGDQDRTPARGLAEAAGPGSAGAQSPRHGQVPAPAPGIWHFTRKRGVLAGAAVIIAVAVTLAALLAAPDHDESNKPPLLAEPAQPTLR